MGARHATRTDHVAEIESFRFDKTAGHLDGLCHEPAEQGRPETGVNSYLINPLFINRSVYRRSRPSAQPVSVIGLRRIFPEFYGKLVDTPRGITQRTLQFQFKQLEEWIRDKTQNL